MFVNNCHVTFDKIMKNNCLSLKIDDDSLFKSRSKRPTLVLRPFLTMLNLYVKRLSPQQLEYGMDLNYYPIDHNCFEKGYCGHLNSPFTNIQLEQTSEFKTFTFSGRQPIIH